MKKMIETMSNKPRIAKNEVRMIARKFTVKIEMASHLIKMLWFLSASLELDNRNPRIILISC